MTQHQTFDRVVDLHVNQRVCPDCNIPLIKKEGDPAVNVEDYYFHGSILAAFCRGAGLPPLNEAPKVYIPENVAVAVDQMNLPSRFIVVNCRSNEPSRDWSDDQWKGLSDRIYEEWHLPVVEVGLESILNGRPNVINLCGQLRLLETAEVIRRARLFIGVDSGPAHLSNAAGTPGVILLGRYRKFKQYCPFSGKYADGSGATIVYNKKGPASDLAVDAVFEAVQEQLKVNSLPSGAPKEDDYE